MHAEAFLRCKAWEDTWTFHPQAHRVMILDPTIRINVGTIVIQFQSWKSKGRNIMKTWYTCNTLSFCSACSTKRASMNLQPFYWLCHWVVPSCKGSLWRKKQVRACTLFWFLSTKRNRHLTVEFWTHEIGGALLHSNGQSQHPTLQRGFLMSSPWQRLQTPGTKRYKSKFSIEA